MKLSWSVAGLHCLPWTTHGVEEGLLPSRCESILAVYVDIRSHEAVQRATKFIRVWNGNSPTLQCAHNHQGICHCRRWLCGAAAFTHHAGVDVQQEGGEQGGQRGRGSSGVGGRDDRFEVDLGCELAPPLPSRFILLERGRGRAVVRGGCKCGAEAVEVGWRDASCDAGLRQLAGDIGRCDLASSVEAWRVGVPGTPRWR
eukprot:4303367-Pleurochrysis_carterae.AAC.1